MKARFLKRSFRLATLRRCTGSVRKIYLDDEDDDPAIDVVDLWL